MSLAKSVNRPRRTDDRCSHALLGELERRLLRCSWEGGIDRRPCVFGESFTGGQLAYDTRHDDRTIRSGEDLSEGLDRYAIFLGEPGNLREVETKRGVDDAVDPASRSPEHVQIGERTQHRLDTFAGERVGLLLGAHQT